MNDFSLWWLTAVPYMQINYVNTEHNSVELWLIYVNMQHEYVPFYMKHDYVNIRKMRLKLYVVFIVILHVDLTICMLHVDINKSFCSSTSNDILTLDDNIKYHDCSGTKHLT
mgnify:CR=1 FL=1